MRHWLLAALLLLFAVPARAEMSVLRIGIQPGMSYLAVDVVRKEALIEKHAPGLKVEWTVSANGAMITDGVLSGNLDMAGTGIPAFVTLWAKGRGLLDIKGIAAYGSIPGLLVTRNPAVKTAADFTRADRIAVPAAKTSVQAILLSMLAEKLYGFDQHDHFDALETTLSHPDAMVAMLSGHSEVNAHFTTSPYYQEELKQPGIHVVMTKQDAFPGPLSNGILWTSERVHGSSPAVVRAVRAALDEAMALIRAEPERAAEDYLSLSKEKISAADIAAIIREYRDLFETTPHGTFEIASFMHRIGMIKVAPASWRDMFFAEGWVDGGS
jgi:NitT/TauT family transport system substrate-binding protein